MVTRMNCPRRMWWFSIRQIPLKCAGIMRKSWSEFATALAIVERSKPPKHIGVSGFFRSIQYHFSNLELTVDESSAYGSTPSSVLKWSREPVHVSSVIGMMCRLWIEKLRSKISFHPIPVTSIGVSANSTFSCLSTVAKNRVKLIPYQHRIAIQLAWSLNLSTIRFLEGILLKSVFSARSFDDQYHFSTLQNCVTFGGNYMLVWNTV